MKIRTFFGLLVVGTAMVVCVKYAPTNLGGSTTYVSTHGTSMLPRFHAGDLAVVQPAGTYHVGDIAAYHSTTLRGATVLHRIIAINEGRFTFKGDKNNFIDPDHPTVREIVGSLRLRIPHGGMIRSIAARPIVLFPLLIVLVAGSTSTAHRKRRRKTASIGGPPARPPTAPPERPRRRLGFVVPIAASIAAAGFLVASIAVWNIPRSEATTRRDAYSQSLTLGYSGTTAKGTAYPHGKFSTGDSVFTRLAKRVDVDLAYAFRSDATARGVGGTYQVMMNVKSATGLSRSLPLTPTRAFSGNRLRAAATLDIDDVRDLETRFAQETGLATSQTTISVAALVRVHGRFASTSFSDDVKSKMDFQLNPDEMIPNSTSAQAPRAATRAGSVVTSAVGAGGLSLWKLHVSAPAARLALLVLFALALAAAAAVLAVDRHRVALGEIDAIMRRYGRLLIAVSAVPPPGEHALVRVESMRALALLAQAHEQPIVHAPSHERHRFVLSTDSIVYCYDALPARIPSAPARLAAA